MKRHLVAFISGALFGLGLAVSQMVNPNKVLAFLDIAGYWDPSLAVVLATSVMTTWIGFHWVLRRSQPLFESAFHLPAKEDFDPYLIIGTAIFGIGWGLAGYCPGPAIAALTLGIWEPIIFVASLIAGSFLYKFLF